MSETIDIDLEAMLENYALSAPYGAVKVGEHWIQQGKEVEEAAEIGINYALGEIEASGSDKQFLADRLHRMLIMTDAIIDALAEGTEVEDPRDNTN